MGRAYLTPDHPEENETCRRLRIPARADFLSLFRGALASLQFESNWEQHGTMTPAETANFWKVVMLEMEDEPNCMLGEVKAFLFEPLPRNVLPCDGGIYLREDWPKLYEFLPAGFRVSDTEFTTPDLQRRGLVGWDVDTIDPDYLLGADIGQATITPDVSQMPEHSHDTIPHNHLDLGHIHTILNVPGITSVVVAPGELPVLLPNLLPGATQPATAGLADAGVTVNPTGGGLPIDIRNPDHVVIWAIVAR